jgi:hypothetical protein
MPPWQGHAPTDSFRGCRTDTGHMPPIAPERAPLRLAPPLVGCFWGNWSWGGGSSGWFSAESGREVTYRGSWLAEGRRSWRRSYRSHRDCCLPPDCLPIRCTRTCSLVLGRDEQVVRFTSGKSEVRKPRFSGGLLAVARACSVQKSGWGGIRTPGTLSRTAVFKTAALVHSATHPGLFL